MTKISSIFLSKKEEYALAKAFFEYGDIEAQEKIILAHQPLAMTIAGKNKNNNFGFDELVQIANIGFLKALQKFDPDNEQGARFGTYAQLWANAEIKSEIMANHNLVKLRGTAKQKKMFFNLKKATRDVRQKNPELSKDEQNIKIADLLGVKSCEVLEMHERLKVTPSLDTPVNNANESGLSWVDLLEGNSNNGETTYSVKEEFAKARDVFIEALNAAKLNDRERDILYKRRFVEDIATLEDLSQKHGVSRERVRQIEIRAWEKILKYTNSITGKNVTFKDLPKPEKNIKRRKNPAPV